MSTQAVPSTKSKKRIAYIDIAKGFAMLCIIAGHFGIVSANRFVYTFHVPLFFLVSGYFLSNKLSFKETTIQKARQLLLPYVVTVGAILVFFAFRVLIWNDTAETLLGATKRLLIAGFWGTGVTISSPFTISAIGLLWFLLALFWAQLIIRLASMTKYPVVIISALAVIGYLTGQILWLPFSIQAGMIGAAFIYLGMMARKYKIFDRKPNAIVVIALLALWCFCIYKGVTINIVSANLGTGWRIPLCVIDALGASYLIILACKFAEKHLRLIARPLNYIGQTTLIIMCFHAVADATFPNYMLYEPLAALGIAKPFSHIVVVGLNILWPLLGVWITYRVPALMKLFSAKQPLPLPASTENR